METKTEKSWSQGIGDNHIKSIVEMVAALNCDYDRLEELRDTSEDELTEEEKAELAELEAEAGECGNADEARERIQEDALEVQVRSDWHSPGEEAAPATEFMILLCTGGPAVRIMGELDEHGEPDRAWLQVQDWGKPWTDYFGISQDTLLDYARCFCFVC